MVFNYTEQIQSLKDREKDLIEIGRQDGLEEAPATPDNEFNATQFDIKFQCQSIVRHLLSDTKISIANYADQLNSHESSLSTGVVLPDIQNIKSTAEQDLKSYLAKEGPLYVDTKVEFWKAEKTRENFKREKGLSDSPIKAPDSIKAHYITLVAYAIIETVINIFVFNDGLSGPDALLLSLFITILNIVPSVIVGNYLRNIYSGDGMLKGLSIILTTFWFLFLLWLNTAVSVLRSFLTESSGAFKAGTGGDLFNNPHITQIFFGDAFSIFAFQAPPIKDVLSIFLWLVGILAGLLACWKGFSSDEKIPELGDLNRDLMVKKESAGVVEKSLRDELSAINGRNLEVFRLVKNKFEQSRRDYISCAQMLNSKVVEFERHIEDIKDEFIHLINVYRDSNKSTRKSPPPEYFSDRSPNFDLPQLPDFSQYSQDKIKEQIATIEGMYSQRTAALNELQAEFNLFLESLNAKFENEIVELDKKASERLIRHW